MKLYHTTIPRSWWPWATGPQTLPSHLPRLLLAKRYQPRFVRRCPVAQAYIAQLQLLDWEQLPTTLAMQYSGERTIPLAAYLGAYLVKLDQGLPTFGALRRFLRCHPALVWALGFPLMTRRGHFDADLSLPSQRHFSKKLSTIPNEIVQTLLEGQVVWLRDQLGADFAWVVAFDTKHIIAWVRENNPKVFIKEGRYDKTRQPQGDPDCKLGCKRRHNQMTPSKEGQPAGEQVSIGEYYWGYASGIVVTKSPLGMEFVLAELTQTFDCGDTTYFFPLMAQVEQRLGCRPRYGTADAAFDAFYIYDYFHSEEHDGFAAIPLRQPDQIRSFDAEGRPRCEAGLSLFLKGSFTNRTSLVQHRRGRFGCPLLHPQPSGENCPINHAKWPDGGCQLVMPLAAGARVRYQIDRQSQRYQAIYSQRTAAERIFSQAVALGIERPKLRNRRAITNLNTLTYVLINLRAMQRFLHAETKPER